MGKGVPARVLGDEGCEGQDKYWTVSGGGGGRGYWGAKGVRGRISTGQ